MEYGFFDYKYLIEGYHGQDFDGAMRYVFLVFCFASIPALIFLLRNTKHTTVTKVLRFLAIFMIVLEVAKVSWESYWDIKTGQGFNAGGILPFDTCSLFLYMLPLAAWGKGKVRTCALGWLSTLGLVGGVSNVLFLQALKYYPFWTFGAMFSMVYHYLMVFVALWIVATRYLVFKPVTMFYAFFPHLLFSVLVIALDYHFGWDYMLYRFAGGVPFVEGVASDWMAAGTPYLTTLLMLGLYFLFTALFTLLYTNAQSSAHPSERYVYS